MTKSQLIARIAERFPYLTARDAARVVNTMFDEIRDTMARDGRVELRGFGSFSVRHRKARRGRNPRSGERVDIPAKKMPFFKTGKGLHERLNSGEDTN